MLPAFGVGLAKTKGEFDPIQACADGMVETVRYMCALKPACTGGSIELLDWAYEIAEMIARRVFEQSVVDAAFKRSYPEIMQIAQTCELPPGAMGALALKP